MSEAHGESTRPKLTVVVVTYNSRDVVADCLSAIGTESDSEIQLIVVDNASSDGTPDYIEQQFPHVVIVRSSVNRGFAGGVLEGVSLAEGDAIGLLNPDAMASREVLLKLVSELDQDKAVGIVGPMISQPNGRLRIVSAGHMPTAWRMFTHYSGLSRLGRLAQVFEGHYLFRDQAVFARDVDWVTGACLVMPSDVWRVVGGIGTRWFMYAEDIELCWRVRESGFRVRIIPELTVTHLVGGSTSGHMENIRSDWVTNLYDFYATDLSHNAVGRFTWRMVVGLGLLSRAAVYRFRARTQGEYWKFESKKFTAYARSVFREESRH
ncbi:hypothetical protein GCM10027414_36560 [Humibacter ginsengiterrae]